MASVEQTPVAILCGGRGTRLQGSGEGLPKPLVEIGGMPILWHVVRLYFAAGFRRFVLLTGFLGEQVAAFAASAPWPDGCSVEVVETGVDTPTGGRVFLGADALGDGTFCLTYADGLADIDLAGLLDEHTESGAAATLTVVRPELPFGVVDVDADGRVAGFVEKPPVSEWVNGGFLVAGPELLNELDAGSTLEGQPLEALAARGQLRAHRHDGFWACMDTYKEAAMLNDMWNEGRAPWRLW